MGKGSKKKKKKEYEMCSVIENPHFGSVRALRQNLKTNKGTRAQNQYMMSFFFLSVAKI
jgi:hypothetical protein